MGKIKFIIVVISIFMSFSVYSQETKKERRKAAREMLKDCKDLAKDIKKGAATYQKRKDTVYITKIKREVELDTVYEIVEVPDYVKVTEYRDTCIINKKEARVQRKNNKADTRNSIVMEREKRKTMEKKYKREIAKIEEQGKQEKDRLKLIEDSLRRQKQIVKEIERTKRKEARLKAKCPSKFWRTLIQIFILISGFAAGYFFRTITNIKL